MENDNERKKSEFKKKLDHFEIKKREVSEKQFEKIKEIQEKDKINFEKIKDKRIKLEKDKEHFYNHVLKYQTTIISRSDLKESINLLDKKNF